MTRDEFLDVVYGELYSDGDNNRANRIIDAADDYVDEYAQPERIRGRWIPVGGALYQCDQCGVVSLKRKFCSECGADMRGEQNG